MKLAAQRAGPTPTQHTNTYLRQPGGGGGAHVSGHITTVRGRVRYPTGCRAGRAGRAADPAVSLSAALPRSSYFQTRARSISQSNAILSGTALTHTRPITFLAERRRKAAPVAQNGSGSRSSGMRPPTSRSPVNCPSLMSAPALRCHRPPDSPEHTACRDARYRSPCHGATGMSSSRDRVRDGSVNASAAHQDPWRSQHITSKRVTGDTLTRLTSLNEVTTHTERCLIP
mmetsp:Transcript_51306/g.133270  ORF Transcript_51306/g.133270 Transcript_51306/m.133270 type:complete len:229 (+) Transcript_51306:37-723(+)